MKNEFKVGDVVEIFTDGVLRDAGKVLEIRNGMLRIETPIPDRWYNFEQCRLVEAVDDEFKVGDAVEVFTDGTRGGVIRRAANSNGENQFKIGDVLEVLLNLSTATAKLNNLIERLNQGEHDEK